MPYLYDYFKETYTPPATSVTLTYYNPLTTRNEIDPHALAAISPFFRTIPSPPNNTFELNQGGKFIHSSASYYCFLAMCKRDSVPLNLTYDNHISFEFGYIAFYEASSLCDFLGIEAAPILGKCDKRLFEDSHYGPNDRTKIVFHQITLYTNNKAALNQLLPVVGGTNGLHKTYYYYSLLTVSTPTPEDILMIEQFGWSPSENAKYGSIKRFSMIE